MIKVRVSNSNPNVFVAIAKNESNHAIGIAVREMKWSHGIGYANPIVCVEDNLIGLDKEITYRKYVVVPAGTPDRPYSRMRAAMAVLASA